MKIADSVIELVFVDVMHALAVREISSQVAFHDNPVLEDRPAAWCESRDDMAVAGETPPRLAEPQAELSCSSGDFAGMSSKRLRH